MTINKTASLFDPSSPQYGSFVVLACIVGGSILFIFIDCLCRKQADSKDIEVIGDFEFSERKEEQQADVLASMEYTKNFYESNVTN
jgi:hypothetical protein